MDIDFVVRNPENEIRCKRIYEMILDYEYGDWMKIIKVIDYLYSANGYIPLRFYEEHQKVLNQIIHNEFFNYEKEASKYIKKTNSN